MTRHLPIFAALLLCATAAAGAEHDPERGAILFRQNCATCHGLSAVGDGPMTAVLNILPPDLTGLSEANAGSFPLPYVARRIDGRDTLLAHGGDMPVFGFILADESAVVDEVDGTPIFTSQAVVDIAAWLATIQR